MSLVTGLPNRIGSNTDYLIVLENRCNDFQFNDSTPPSFLRINQNPVVHHYDQIVFLVAGDFRHERLTRLR